MERVKAMIPDGLKQRIKESNTESLEEICSDLLKLMMKNAQFLQLVDQLTQTAQSPCSKDQSTASLWKSQGNEAFCKPDYSHALQCYTKALRYVPFSPDKRNTTMIATLFYNRASAMHKLRMLNETVRDCNRAVELQPSYSKAWYLRGQANAELKYFQDAINDMQMALVSEVSSSEKMQIKKMLADIQDLYRRSTNILQEKASRVLSDGDIDNSSIMDSKVNKVLTREKGWEMQANCKVQSGELLICEDPYAGIILKSHRDTHCHFCFRILPADCIPCHFCSIPLYCSEYCMEIAGKGFSRSKIFSDSSFSSQTFDDYCNQIHTLTIKETDAYQMEQSEQVKEFFPQHKHECGGMSWPAVFPVEVSLAARVLMKSTKKMSPNSSLNHTDLMLPQLCQHYEKMKLADRLELHVFALVLVLCLHTSNQNIQLTGSMIAIGILAIAQVKTNAMAVVDITNMDGADNIAKSSSTLLQDSMCPIEQVQVAQAVYLTGSSFNHSCLPNVHASFSNRSLRVHAIKDVAAGSPLELCYGPQVGEFRLEARQRWLEERYMFLCTCKGCSELNFSDLTLSSFRCSNDLCDGVVIDGDVRLERPSASNFVRYISDHSWKLTVPADFDTREKLNQVAHLLMAEHSSSMREFSSAHCLSCGLPCDIIGRQNLVSHSWECLKRAKTEVSLPSTVPNERFHNIAMQSLKSLRSVLHKFHKDVAQAEDVVAEILCMMGQYELALHHLKESVKILEAIYHNTHIVVGNELVKLVSVALCVNKSECTKYFERIDQLFSAYYGCNYAKQFPYLETISNLIHELE